MGIKLLLFAILSSKSGLCMIHLIKTLFIAKILLIELAILFILKASTLFTWAK